MNPSQRRNEKNGGGGGVKYREFGAEKAETILLLHGGGLSWWNYQEEARLLESDYHVILPILDGHAGSGRPFTTIERNAEEILALIDQTLGGSVLLIGGLSLGGQILLEMLSQRGNICRFALVESAAVIPSKLTNALIGPAFSGSYWLMKNRTFAKAQFKALRMKPELFEDYYRDTCAIEKEDLIAFMKANMSYALKETLHNVSSKVHVYIGEKENREIAQSAKAIHEAVPGSHVHILKGLYHGQFSINQAEDYVRAVKAIVGGAEPDF